jgi:U3 small nucleolar RNA-associated protein 4
LTSTNDIFEFEVLKGTLSPWSRRNPSDIFSETFRRNKDIAKGAFWEVGDGKERVWLYSIGWLWMFDISRDLPLPEDTASTNDASSTPNKKRKRGPERNTGAGSVIPDSRLLTGMSRKMHLAEQDVSSVQFNVFSDAMDLDENDEAENKSALQLLRRGSKSAQESDGFKHEWHTYKYRPILGAGIVSVNSSEDKTISLQNGEQETDQKSRFGSNGAFEIVIVERPAFEADMPDRYIGDQEWEKGDYVG